MTSNLSILSIIKRWCLYVLSEMPIHVVHFPSPRTHFKGGPNWFWWRIHQIHIRFRL